MSTAKGSSTQSGMVLAGDVGGTKTRLGLFTRGAVRPELIQMEELSTSDVVRSPAAMRRWADQRRGTAAIEAACFGVAGPVIGETAELTNVRWHIEAASLAELLEISRVALVNDLQALAFAVPLLEPSELHELQRGIAVEGGNVALIAAGTGLGEAMLHNVNGRLVPSPSEGGNADWAARNEREIALLRDLIARFGRAAVEYVVSGRGLVNIHRVSHEAPCSSGVDIDDPAAPAAISSAARERRCAGCVRTLDMFVDAYGAEAGNLALRAVATGGVFVGGGIAPKILPALTDGLFMRSFRNKPPFVEMLARVPVTIILHPQAGLLGAAVHASTLQSVNPRHAEGSREP
jgi:glucokinase